MPATKTYLGDSVYAKFTGYGIVLTTENGDGPPPNTIYIEPDVYDSLVKFVASLKRETVEPGAPTSEAVSKWSNFLASRQRDEPFDGADRDCDAGDEVTR